MTFSQLTSVGGYNLAEVASALQKSIRRGLEQEALFWATELDISGYGEYCWKRLRIITSEDVGLAGPNLPATIQALSCAWTEQRKKKDERHGPERLFLVHAVILLARAAKSRLVDHALIVYYEARAQLPTPQMPDYALDKHTPRGRKLRRGHDHFWTEGAQIANPASLGLDPYYETAKVCRTDANPENDQPSNESQPDLI